MMPAASTGVFAYLVVTAPKLEDETVRAYFSKAPVGYRGEGGVH